VFEKTFSVASRFRVRKFHDGWHGVEAALPVTDKCPTGGVWAMVTAFGGGSDGGKAEADRYCALLNRAVEDFFAGKGV
jgi:hypothetical protein